MRSAASAFYVSSFASMYLFFVVIHRSPPCDVCCVADSGPARVSGLVCFCVCFRAAVVFHTCAGASVCALKKLFSSIPRCGRWMTPDQAVELSCIFPVTTQRQCVRFVFVSIRVNIYAQIAFKSHTQRHYPFLWHCLALFFRMCCMCIISNGKFCCRDPVAF